MNRQINNKPQRVIRKRSKFDLKGKHLGYTIGLGSIFIVIAAMATFALARITQYTLAPDEILEANCEGRGFSIEPISRTEVSLKCVEDDPTVVPTAVVPTEVPPTEVPPTEVPPTEVPPTEVPPTTIPDHPILDVICDDIPVNLVKNANFNDANYWQFYSDGSGDFSIEGGGYCGNASRLNISAPGENVQFYQQDIALDPNTTYLFAFIGKSNNGHDLSVNLHKHDPNYDTYGMQDYQVDMTTDWQAFFLEFDTSILSSSVNDGRLRFWLAPFDAAGDVYWIDQVTIMRADLLNMPPLPPVLPLPVEPGTDPTSEPTILPPTTEPTEIPPTNTPVPPTATVAPTNTVVPPTQEPVPAQISVNFQQEGAPLPAGYVADYGVTFRDQNGLSYGWEADNTAQTRYHSWFKDDDRLASFTHIQRGGGKWEITVPNGTYQVSGASGDPRYTNQVNHLLIEGVRVEDTIADNNFDTFMVVVDVADGKLTIEAAADADNAKLSYVDIATSNGAPIPTATSQPPTNTPVPPPTATPGSYPSPGGYPSPGEQPAPGGNEPQANRGNVVAVGDNWAWENGDAFVPQLVMVGGPQVYWNGSSVDTAAIDAEIDRFINQHGFNGFHMPVFCRWWDLDSSNGVCYNGMSQPDERTFAVLEEFISRTYEAGGMVHFWMYGDSARSQNPGNSFGHGSQTEKNVLNEIGARLGPIPGWTMGYGFDVFEWASSSQIEAWHNYLQGQMSANPHLLGARGTKNAYNNWSNDLEYWSAEWHQPTYYDYIDHLNNANGRPAFSEDRFRLGQDHAYKAYTMDMTRRGMWHSTLAGGVANIWGNLTVDATDINMGLKTSQNYPNPEQIKTYSDFWNGRFNANMTRCGDYCISDGNITVLYGENVSTLGTQSGIAVDTKLPYAEISIADGQLPYASDWAIILGQ